VEVKNVQAVPTVCNHGPLKAHRGSRVFIFERRKSLNRFIFRKKFSLGFLPGRVIEGHL
jgi:hypothetical protein